MCGGKEMKPNQKRVIRKEWGNDFIQVWNRTGRDITVYWTSMGIEIHGAELTKEELDAIQDKRTKSILCVEDEK